MSGRREKSFEEIEAEINAEVKEIKVKDKEPVTKSEGKIATVKAVDKEWEEIETQGLNIWTPLSRGDKIEGKVVAIREGPYGVEAAIEVAEEEEPIITPAHKILQGKLEQLEIGDYVRIIYLGEVVTKGKRNARDYMVGRKRK